MEGKRERVNGEYFEEAILKQQVAGQSGTLAAKLVEEISKAWNMPRYFDGKKVAEEDVFMQNQARATSGVDYNPLTSSFFPYQHQYAVTFFTSR